MSVKRIRPLHVEDWNNEEYEEYQKDMRVYNAEHHYPLEEPERPHTDILDLPRVSLDHVDAEQLPFPNKVDAEEWDGYTLIP